MAIKDYVLVDKKLVDTEDYALDSSGDLAIVTDDYNILQVVLNRCVARRNSWMHDESFGNELPLFLKNGSVELITDDIAYGYIFHALKSLIDDGRLTSLDRVTVIGKEDNSISLEIYVTIGTDRGVVSFEI